MTISRLIIMLRNAWAVSAFPAVKFNGYFEYLSLTLTRIHYMVLKNGASKHLKKPAEVVPKQ